MVIHLFGKLHCIVLCCVALYCFVLGCIVFHCICDSDSPGLNKFLGSASATHRKRALLLHVSLLKKYIEILREMLAKNEKPGDREIEGTRTDGSGREGERERDLWFCVLCFVYCVSCFVSCVLCFVFFFSPLLSPYLFHSLRWP
jgi:hypothetical protein